MLSIIYSFNKKGYEADYWRREISGASDHQFRFIPFNHDPYLRSHLYGRAQLLDNLYHSRHPRLLGMYEDFETLIRATHADALIVDNCFPYHPDYLRRLRLYKVLRTSDGPLSFYDRDLPYLHAYQHVLYHSPAFSSDMGMAEKLHYCGAANIDFWPHALFDAAFDSTKREEAIRSGVRDIDVVFVGAILLNKMPILAKVKKALRRRFILHGLITLKRNVYFNVKFGFPGWIRPIPSKAYVPLYQRAKIGINVHNRGDYTVGSYRLFDLPGNGVMQISDGGKKLNDFFDVGREIVGYENADDLLDKISYYLDHEEERQEIALSGYRRVMKDHRFRHRMRQAGQLIEAGMTRIGWRRTNGY